MIRHMVERFSRRAYDERDRTGLAAGYPAVGSAD